MSGSNPNIRLDIFFHIFMYELEVSLNEHKNEMLEIQFQSDEANTDRALKEFLKYFILKRITCIPQDKSRNSLCIKYVDETGNPNFNSYKYRDYTDFRIIDVLLPEEITNEHKQNIAQSKAAVYTNPDLLLIITDDQKNTFYKTIELKSTKNDSIPGSSVQQVNPLEWVIFVKHSNNQIYVTTGQYINSINSKLQFPDRSPRPQVSFKELESWNKINRTVKQGRLEYIFKNSDVTTKYQLLEDWQNYLAERWLKIVMSDSLKAKEPWFNNAIRKFTIKLINHYDGLGSSEKIKFMEIIEKLIQR